MHHAPAGPPFFARVAAFLARARYRAAGLLGPLATLVVVLRRMRVLPLALAALTLGAFAVAAPLAPYDDDARSTAALSSTAGDANGLVPATGDGWTQDGAPAAPSPAAGASSSSASSSASSAPSAAVVPADNPASASSSGSRTESSPESPVVDTPPSSPTDTPSADPAAPSSSVSAEPDAPSTPTTTAPEVATSAADPGDQVLSAVNTARTAAGCGALTVDAGLAERAAEHSAALSEDDDADVRSSDGETWVVTTGTDPSAVADDLLGEDALLDCDLTSAGVGTVDGFSTLVAA